METLVTVASTARFRLDDETVKIDFNLPNGKPLAVAVLKDEEVERVAQWLDRVRARKGSH